VITPPAPAVKVDQIWRDNDPRGPRREIRVLDITTNRDGQPCAVVQPAWGRGRKTAIRIDRFKPGRSGYTLVHDAPGVTK
jgi:hypothetical protein